MAKAKWGVIYNGDTLPLDDILHFASLAEKAGADVVWTAEGWRDAFVPLTAIAGVAKNLRVGTAIRKWLDHQFSPPSARFLWQSLPTENSYSGSGPRPKSGTRIGMGSTCRSRWLNLGVY